MKTRLLIAAAIAAASVQAALLDPQGRPYQEIVVAEDAASTVKIAANDLRDFLARRCGAELRQVSKPTTVPFILVGNSPELAKQGLSADSFPTEGYAIRTGKDYLAFYGRDYNGKLLHGWMNPWRPIETYNPELKLSVFGEAGTLNAVNEFLQGTCGIRFYMPGEIGTVIPPKGDIRLTETSIQSAPKVNYRWPWFCMVQFNPDAALWLRRVGFGGKAPVMIIHSYDFLNRFQKTHPEYFALAGGKRAFGSECVASGKGHLCLTNPDVVKQWSEDIINFFRENPDFDVYPLAPNDGLTRICECPNCSAELRPNAPEEGKFSYHIWNFTRKVAENVGKVFPNKYVGCLAYEKYRMPPEEFKNMPNVAVMFCHARSSMASPENAKRLRDEITAWTAKVDRIYLWDWYLDHWMPWKGLPVVFDDTISRELKWMLSNPKFGGEFFESEPQGGDLPWSKRPAFESPALQHWSLYVTGRLYQHPDADVNEMYQEYCKLFYGKAANTIREFWNTCRDARNDALSKSKSTSPDAVYPTSTLLKLRELIAKGLKEAAGDEAVTARIKMLSDEFELGASRLIRLESSGKRNHTLQQLENGLASFANVKPQQFLGKSGEAGNPPTWLYTGFDRQYLYFRFICYEPQMDKLVLKATKENPGNIWEDDSVEIFICPDETKRNDCYQMIITANGIFTIYHHQERGKPDLPWTSNVKVTTVKEANRWKVDVTLPLADIGINDPFFAGMMAAEFYRNRLGLDPMNAQCWSPTGEKAHYVPKNFGTMKFK